MHSPAAFPVLNDQQIREYHESGFIVVEDFLTPQELESLREAEASPAIQSAVEDQGIKSRTVHLLELTTRHPAFLELARSPRIMDWIRPLLGEDIQLQHSKLATKAVTKGTGAFGWHQDLMFYPHTNDSLLSVFVYLDDATLENGCMSMVRGSHRGGPLNHLDGNGYFTSACQDSSQWESQPDRVVALQARAGSISIHHCLTLHGSSANLSGKPRRGLVFSYRADDAYQLGDTIFEDTGLVVSGKRRGVVRCELGSWLLPRRAGRGRKDYGSAYHQVGDWSEKLNAEVGGRDRADEPKVSEIQV